MVRSWRMIRSRSSLELKRMAAHVAHRKSRFDGTSPGNGRSGRSSNRVCGSSCGSCPVGQDPQPGTDPYVGTTLGPVSGGTEAAFGGGPAGEECLEEDGVGLGAVGADGEGKEVDADVCVPWSGIGCGRGSRRQASL